MQRGSFYSGNFTSIGFDRGRIEVIPQVSIEPSLEFNWIDLPQLEAIEGQFDSTWLGRG